MGRRRVVKHSKGEKLCGATLRTLFGKANVRSQFILMSPLNTFYIYDFYFKHKDIEYLVEYDGIQHFEYCQIIHRKPENFHSRFQRDVDKTALGLVCGYRLIRIDYSVVDETAMKEILIKAVESNCELWVSEENKYKAFMKCDVHPKICQLVI